MTRKFSLFLTVALLVILMVSAVGVYAQGPGGNGNGGNGGPNSDQCVNNPADCEQNQNQNQNQQGNQNQQQNQQQDGTCPLCDQTQQQNQFRQGNQIQNQNQSGSGPMMRQGGNGQHFRVGANAVWAREPVETMEEALALADEYVDDMYIVGEVVELDTMYYIPIYEGTTPVFELWINKETGFIMGMQMNQYGNRFMVNDTVQVLLDEALVMATDALEANQVLGDVIVFDDHYIFPVLENGVIVALLKISAYSGNLFWYE